MDHTIDIITRVITGILTLLLLIFSKYLPDFFAFLKKKKYLDTLNLKESIKDFELNNELQDITRERINEDIFFFATGIRSSMKDVKKLKELKEKTNSKWRNIKDSIVFIDLKREKASIKITPFKKYTFYIMMVLFLISTLTSIFALLLIDKKAPFNEKLFFIVLFIVYSLMSFYLFLFFSNILVAIQLKKKCDMIFNEKEEKKESKQEE